MLGIFKALDAGAEVHRHRRNLPHWQQPECTYFITFRLADSLPQTKLRALNKERNLWLRSRSVPWDAASRAEYNQLFTARIHEWLDKGYGECHLSNPAARIEMESAMGHFDGARYSLDQYAVMPNHVHVLVQPAESLTLPALLHSWKSYSAMKINDMVGRSGPLWMDEYFDHAVRSWEQMEHYRRYIMDNPQKAGLGGGMSTVGCGSGVRLWEGE